MFDSLADAYLASPRVAALFDARATLARMLEFEAALARAQAALGMIPVPAAAIIASACEVSHFDIDAIKRETAASSSPTIPLVAALTALVAKRDAAAACYVHWGSSTQDVMDSALMLQARAALDVLLGELSAIAAELAALCDGHRDTLMVARTLSQHALPTVFGYKCALWLHAMLNGAAECERLANALPLQFGGAAGTLAAYGSRGVELRDAVARDLELCAVLPWHTERSAPRALAAALAMLAASAGKLGNDLILMMQSEVAELSEGGGGTRGGSTAMPHKRNPVAAIAVVAGAHRVPGQLAALFSCFSHAHERASGAWHAEWQALREMFVTVGGMLEQLHVALDGLRVHGEAMRANLERGQGLVMAEAVAMALAPSLERGAAQALLKQAVVTAVERGVPLATVLADDATVRHELGSEGLAEVMAPRNYLGASAVFSDEVMARYRAWRAGREAI
ncbi:MAG: 3-carboxy-cis,cis-muconate cycloisomerase [Proteobacteria bacterium]|nr:3-carboxy-cis,cis-muconate cycloisomerase [Pseudomonadota bacterium]